VGNDKSLERGATLAVGCVNDRKFDYAIRLFSLEDIAAMFGDSQKRREEISFIDNLLSGHWDRSDESTGTFQYKKSFIFTSDLWRALTDMK
jgi:hypothetical protein